MVPHAFAANSAAPKAKCKDFRRIGIKIRHLENLSRESVRAWLGRVVGSGEGTLFKRDYYLKS